MIFDIYKIFKDNLPPRKKGKRSLALAYALADGLAYLKIIFFNVFRQGSPDPLYSAGTYQNRDRVIYQLSVFESTANNNTSTPEDLTKWRKLQISHVGVNSRVKFNGEKLQLEYALNKIFRTVFTDPPTYGEIYIENAAADIGSFTVGIDEDESSTVEAFDSSEYIYDTEISLDGINFTIWFPIAVFNALGTDDAARNAFIRNIVDVYACGGIKYAIDTY